MYGKQKEGTERLDKVTFWKRMTKRIEEREVEEKKKKKEENDRLKRTRCFYVVSRPRQGSIALISQP